jgi:hypothetical protein
MLAVAALTTILLQPATGYAQVTVVDEGSFTITVNGTAAGRENFWIRTTPDPRGTVYIATATSVIGGRRIEPRELAAENGSALRYDVKLTTNGDVQQTSGVIERSRMSMNIRNARGESAREFVVSDGALILDEDIFHQYFFLARRGTQGTVPVIVPRRNAQVTARVSTSGSEALTIGGATLQARHLVVAQGGVTTDVWVDADGRVLKVAIPSRGLIALRDDPPKDR